MIVALLVIAYVAGLILGAVFSAQYANADSWQQTCRRLRAENYRIRNRSPGCPYCNRRGKDMAIFANYCPHCGRQLNGGEIELWDNNA